MTIYAIGNTPADFDSFNIGDAHISTGYGSTGYQSVANTPGTFVNTTSAGTPFKFNFTESISDFWFTVHGGSIYVKNNSRVLSFSDNDVECLRFYTVGGGFSVQLRNGASWVTVIPLVACTFNNGGSRIDMKVKIDPTVGEIEVYINGFLQGSFLGNTQLSTSTTFNQCSFFNFRYDRSYNSYWSQVLVQSDTTLQVEVLQGIPDATSFYQEQDSGGLTDINNSSARLEADIAKMVCTNPADKSTFTTTGIPAQFDTGWVVTNIVSVVRASSGAGSTINAVAPMVRTATGVDSFALDLPTDLTPATVFAEFPLNPATGLAWTIPESETATVGVRVASV